MLYAKDLFVPSLKVIFYPNLTLMSESWRNMSWPRAIYFVFSDWWCFNTRLPCTALVGFRRALCTDGTDSILSTLVNVKLRRNDVSTQITPGFQNSTSNVSNTDWPIRQLNPPVDSRSWLATTEATNCPDRMSKNLKSKSMGDLTFWVGHPVALTSTTCTLIQDILQRCNKNWAEGYVTSCFCKKKFL